MGSKILAHSLLYPKIGCFRSACSLTSHSPLPSRSNPRWRRLGAAAAAPSSCQGHPPEAPALLKDTGTEPLPPDRARRPSPSPRPAAQQTSLPPFFFLLQVAAPSPSSLCYMLICFVLCYMLLLLCVICCCCLLPLLYCCCCCCCIIAICS